MVSLHAWQPRWARAAGERPVVSPLVRWQLAHGEPAVASLRHVAVVLDSPLYRRLRLLCDGTRDRAALASELGAWQTGEGAGLVEKAVAGDELTRVVAENLDRAAGAALFVA